MKKKIYLICPVRQASEDVKKTLEAEVQWLEDNGFEVFYPPRDVNQDDETGYNIVMTELEAIKNADEVDIYWDAYSKGSHFDLGMAIALGKPLRLLNPVYDDSIGKSYFKVIDIIQKIQRDPDLKELYESRHSR